MGSRRTSFCSRSFTKLSPANETNSPLHCSSHFEPVSRCRVISLLIAFALVVGPIKAIAAPAQQTHFDNQGIRARAVSSSPSIGKLKYVPYTGGKKPVLFEIYKDGKPYFEQKDESDQTGDHRWLCFPYQASRRIRHKRAWNSDITDFLPPDARSKSSPFLDLKGNGIQHIVVTTAVGNRGNSYAVYKLGPRPELFDKLETIRSYFKFADIDSDGKFEAVGFDDNFMGWNECNAMSPMPVLVLRPGKSHFELADDLMRSDPPNPLEQERICNEWTKQILMSTAEHLQTSSQVLSKQEIDIPSSIWKDMLNLIYSGNSKIAWRLLDEAWPKGTMANGFKLDRRKDTYALVSEAEFKLLFIEKLSHSKYYAGVKKLNPTDRTLQSLIHPRNTDVN